MGGKGYDVKVHLTKDTYANGETLKGYITLSLPETKEMTTIMKIRVGGYEKALFYVPPNTDTYFSLPFYYNDTVIWSPKGDAEEMKAGKHKFPFSIALPYHLAPSFNYIDTTSVCYGLYVFFSDPAKEKEKEKEKENEDEDDNNNNVNNNNNNNNNGKNEKGEKGKKDKKDEDDDDEIPPMTEFFIYGTKKIKWKSVISGSVPSIAKACKTSILTKSKPVELSACIRQRDFMIGDKITIHAQVRNYSGVVLNSIQAQLVQTVKISSDTLQKNLGRMKLISHSLLCSIALYSKDQPTPYFQLELPVPQENKGETTFPTATGKVIRVDHYIVVSLPDVDVQCMIPVCLWDEVINYTRDSSTQIEGTIDWEEHWLPAWEDDETVTQCSICKQSFNVFNRKHHCRSCGLVLCAECTPYKEIVKNLGYTEPVRICRVCYTSLPTSPSPPAPVSPSSPSTPATTSATTDQKLIV